MKKDLNGIYYLSSYEPYHGGENSNFTKETGGYVLDVKDNIDKGIKYFSDKIVQALYEHKNLRTSNAILTCMPRSKKNEIRPGMIRLLKTVCSEYTNMKYIKCLNREKEIPKKANGGPRSLELELDSLEVCYNVKDKDIILFDDVTTSGNSLLAGCQKLKDAGAKKVICIALGKTI